MLRKTVVVSLFVGLLTATASAAGYNFYRIASSSGSLMDNPYQATYYMNVATEQHMGGPYVRMDLVTVQRFNNQAMSNTAYDTIEFDCTGRRTRMIYSVAYDNKGKKSRESIKFNGFSDEDPDDIFGMSAGDHALNGRLETMTLDFVCSDWGYRNRFTNTGSSLN